MTPEKQKEVEQAFVRIAARMNRLYDGILPRVEFDRVTDLHMSGRVVWDDECTETERQASTEA